MSPTNPIEVIERMVGDLRVTVGPLTEGMAGIVSSIEAMEPTARKFAANATRPLIHEVASSVEALAAPLRAAERKLARISKGP